MTTDLPPAEVPAGITFGVKMLLVPAVSDVFSHSGSLVGLREGKSYSWIKRGDAIARYSMSVRKLDVPVLGAVLGDTEHTAEIRSPVSGLIIHSDYRHGLDTYDFKRFGDPDFSPPVRMAILLPDDEPPPESGSYMFRDLITCCWNNRAPFLKPSRRWSMAAYAESDFKTHCDEQYDLVPHIVDAMPRYSEYFQEARTRYPQLRPYLKHLL